MNIEGLIKVAQAKLITSPFDQGHDLVHHYKVWENCFEIIMAEKLIEVDFDNLQLAVWFHDVDRDSKDNPTFLRAAKDFALSNDEITNVLDIMNAHSFSDERSGKLEAKILFDADKVEYIGYSRWLYISNAIKNGDMSLESGLKYAEALNGRMEYVVANINFNRTKVMLKRNLDATIFLKDKGLLVKEVSTRIAWNLLNGLFK